MADLNLPSFPQRVWWNLRDAFKKTVPKKVTNSYLATVLGINEKSAAKYYGNLAKIGLIEPDGSPSDIAYDWREDDKYKEVCLKIIKTAYPEELIDISQPPHIDEDKVLSWITRHERLGDVAAKNKTATYMLIAKGELPSDEQSQPLKKATPSTSRAATNRNTGGSQTAPRQTIDSAPSQNRRAEIDTSINLNIQIHISRACYALVISLCACLSMRQTKATMCSPASVVA